MLDEAVKDEASRSPNMEKAVKDETARSPMLNEAVKDEVMMPPMLDVLVHLYAVTFSCATWPTHDFLKLLKMTQSAI